MPVQPHGEHGIFPGSHGVADVLVRFFVVRKLVYVLFVSQIFFFVGRVARGALFDVFRSRFLLLLVSDRHFRQPPFLIGIAFRWEDALAIFVLERRSWFTTLRARVHAIDPGQQFHQNFPKFNLQHLL